VITFEDAYRGWLAVRYPDRSLSPAVQLLIAELNDAVQQYNIPDVAQFVERLGEISGHLDTWGEGENAIVERARAVYEVPIPATHGLRILQLEQAERLLHLAAVQCMSDRPCYAMVHFLLGIVLYDQGMHQDASRAWGVSRRTLLLLAKSHSQFTPRSGWYQEVMDAIPKLVAQNQVVFGDVLPDRVDDQEWPFNYNPGEEPVSTFYEKPHSNLPG
jgi:hypothetical protein